MYIYAISVSIAYAILTKLTYLYTKKDFQMLLAIKEGEL